MRLIALFSVAALVGLAFETIIPRWLPVGSFLPDLLLVLAVDLGLKHHDASAALMAFGMGYATDSFSGTHLGLNAFMFTLVFLATFGLSRYLISTSSAIGVIVVFLGAMVTGLVDYGVGAGWEGRGSLAAVFPAVALRASVSALLAPWVFGLMGSLKRAVGLRQRSVRE